MSGFDQKYLQNPLTGALIRIASPYEMHEYEIQQNKDTGVTRYIYTHTKSLVPIPMTQMLQTHAPAKKSSFYARLRMFRKRRLR